MALVRLRRIDDGGGIPAAAYRLLISIFVHARQPSWIHRHGTKSPASAITVSKSDLGGSMPDGGRLVW